MAIIKDISNLTVMGNNGAVIIPLHDGNLLRAGKVFTGETNGIYKSTDGGSTWTLKYTYATTGWNSRLSFIDSLGNIYIGTINTVTAGHMFRSTDNGETWTDVATSEGSGWWRMCEQPSTGYLYASEYSIGNKDAAELYAYNIWRSTNLGKTWSKFYTAPQQSTPGAMDGIRHIHGIWCDKDSNLYIGFGDPTFAVPATYAYRLNNNGTLGTLLDTTANGYTAFCQTNSGKILTGGDQNPVKIYQIDPLKNTSTPILDLNAYFGSTYNTAVFDIVVGKYGVIYALTNGATGLKPSTLIASPDDGITWVVLLYAPDLVGANFLKVDYINGYLYIARAESTNIVYARVPDLKPTDIIGTQRKGNVVR